MQVNLRDRRQCVILNGYSSSERQINVEITQMSILGPLLFLIYINDLPNAFSIFLSVLYADDTTLLISSSDYSNLIQTVNDELPKIHKWCVANRLSISMDKTYSMLFSNRLNTITGNGDIFLNGQPVKIKASEDILGLILDDKFKFESYSGSVQEGIKNGWTPIQK